MSDTLEIFGHEYTNVAGFKATDDVDATKTYIRPEGTLSITSNGTVDVSQYASASVAVSSGGITPSGTMSITSNGTYDVTSYASADVSVPTGVDIPIFTLTFDSNFEAPQSITCNKTLNECYNLNYNGDSGAYVIQTNGVEEYTDTAFLYDIQFTGGVLTSLKYVSHDAYYDIVYTTNGITANTPSDYPDELNATENGTYTAQNVYKTVTVNVPDSVYAFGLVTDSIDSTLFIPDNLSPTTIVTNARATVGNVAISGPNEHITVQFMSFDDTIPTTVGNDQYYDWITYLVHDAYSVSGKVIESQIIYGLVNNTPKAAKIFQNSYYNTSTGDAVASQVMAGKVFYNASGASTGTATTRASSDLTVSGSTVTAPAGFYAAAATKVIKPKIKITSSGSNMAYIQLNGTGTKYYTAGDEIEFEEGDTLYLYCYGRMSESTITLNGATLIQNSSSAATWTLTLQKYDISVALYSGSFAYVNVTMPLITSGTYTVPSAGIKQVVQYSSISVASGSTQTPATTITANPTILVSSSGLITASASASQSITPNITAGYITAGTGGTVTVNGSTTSQLSVQASTTVTPTETLQTAVAAGKYTTGAVNVAAIPNDYVGSGITTRSSSDLTVNAATVTAPAGYYSTVATKAVAAGSVANPTAAKGTVSNHAITVTPSVNSTTGYITGGTKSGTAVTVSASELVSGTLNITSAGTSNVTNYASASVAAGSVGTPTAAKGSVSNHSITVTPSVASTTGFITGGSKSGTGVTVSASELVSGSQTITSNGTVDVTNLASVSVALTFSQITISSSNPSGGNNGDIWIKTS